MDDRRNSGREITVSREFSVHQPMRQHAFVIPETDWKRVERAVRGIIPSRDVHQILASILAGVFLTSGSVLTSFYFVIPTPPNWAWTTAICATICSLLLAIALFVFHLQQQATTVRTVNSALSEMGDIRRDLAPPWSGDSPLDGDSAKESNLRIISALYGAGDGGWKDVTGVLISRISDGSLRIAATNEELGSDPAPYKVKNLVVAYMHNGEACSRSVSEGEELSIPGV